MKRTFFILTCIILLSSERLSAQCDASYVYTSDNGNFAIDAVAGCTGLTVELCLDSSLCGTNCNFNFGDGSNVPNGVGPTVSHTYSTPGSYEVTVIFPGGGQDKISVTVTENQAPDFNIFACSSNSVGVIINNPDYDNYLVDYGDGSVVQVDGSNIPVYTYASSGTYTITVEGFNDNAVQNCSSSSATFSPYAALPTPAINRIEVVDDATIDLQYSVEQDIRYELQIQPNGSGSFTRYAALDNSVNAVSIVGNGITPLDQYYCFRIAAIDICTNAYTYSPVACTILVNAETADSENSITWNTNSPSSSFSLARTTIVDGNRSTTNPYAQAGSGARAYSDTDIFCQTEYCYILEGTFNGAISISNEACVTSISAAPPPAVNDISIITTETGNELVWTGSPGEVSEYRVTSNGTTLSATTDSEFTHNLTLSGSVCYRIATLDDCNTASQSKNVCSIYLKGSISRDGSVELSWNNFNGFAGGVATYQLQKYVGGRFSNTININGNSYQENDQNTDQQVLQYVVSAIPATSALPAAVSNTRTLIKPTNIYYPNAFTPDGNGSNDTFIVGAKFTTSYDLKIFNRWGQLIFYSNNPNNGWDGTYNGSPAPEGTYLFTLNIVDTAGREDERTDSFILMRK